MGHYHLDFYVRLPHRTAYKLQGSNGILELNPVDFKDIFYVRAVNSIRLY